jgi:hypothetical protein
MLCWLLTALCLYGAWLNIHKNPYGFAIWAFVDMMWCIHDYNIGELAQSFYFFAYFLLSIYGMLLWIVKNKKKEKEAKNSGEKLD